VQHGWFVFGAECRQERQDDVRDGHVRMTLSISRAARRRGIRRGFTLMETITAIALTAIVITIAAAALAAASDSREKIAQYEATLEAESRWRALVIDMLRHAPAADAVDEPLLRIGMTDGAPSLTFLSKGVVQPFGTGRIWRVTLHNTSAGVTFDAEAIGRGPAASPLQARLSHLRLIDVAARDDGTSIGGWRGDWPVERSRPVLLRLSFANTNGSPATPLFVNLSPIAGAAQ
jgi:prepilin-type N-terminal cleavage/methylation domain-containing protein